MARAAGVTALGVAWGYHPADELVAAGAAAVVARSRDLSRAVLPYLSDEGRDR